MPFLTIELRTARGEVLQQVFDEGAIARVRPPLDDSSSACLRFIDPYGDTVFNPLQAAVLSEELNEAMRRRGKAEDHKHLSQVIEIADRCAAGVHVHLLFIGD